MLDEDRVLQALRLGNNRMTAARYAGASLAELERAISNDPDFRAKVDLAEAECEVKCVGAVMMAAMEREARSTKKTTKPDGTVIEEVKVTPQSGFSAARFWLEKNRRETYGR